MARQKQVDKPALTQDLPWYQYTDWWEGLTASEVEAKILEASRESGPGAWIVVPAGYLTRQEQTTHTFPAPSSDDLIEAVRRMPPNEARAYPELGLSVRDRAWTIYMELTRARGYSPEHAKNAWKGARDFAAEGGNNGN